MTMTRRQTETDNDTDTDTDIHTDTTITFRVLHCAFCIPTMHMDAVQYLWMPTMSLTKTDTVTSNVNVNVYHIGYRTQAFVQV
jgi:hypothetical protein